MMDDISNDDLREQWIEDLDFQNKRYDGRWLTHREAKELIMLLKEKGGH